MTYQNFLISSYKDGIRKDQQPWLSPADAWEDMLDTYIHRGVVKKRLGYQELDRFVEATKTITGITQADPGVVTSTGHGISDDTIIRLVDITGMVEANGQTYVVSNAAANTFELKDLAGNDVDTSGFTAYTSGGKICLFTKDNIMGIMNWIDTNGIEQLIIANEDRLCSWDTSGEYLEPITQVSETIGFGDGSTTAFSVTGTTYTSAEIITGSVTVTATISGSTVTLTDDGATPTAALSGSGHSGTFTWATGATSLTFATAPDDGTEITVAYTYYGDLFTGDEEDFFNWTNYENELWMTNGEDAILAYDGTSIRIPLIDPANTNGVYTSSVKVSSCKDIQTSRERLILFGVKEGGDWYYQRIRWPQAGSTTIWDDTIAGKGDYIDVSTGDHFQFSQLVKESIVVAFQRSMWLLRYTGDPNLAFRIDRITASNTTDSPFVNINFDDFTVGLGTENIYACDGNSIRRIDEKIPDQSLEIDQDFIQKSFGIKIDEEEQAWISYVNKNDDSSTATQDRVLVWNYQDNSWSKFRIGMSCFGRYFQNAGKRLSSFPGMTLHDLEGKRLNDFTWQSKAPITLGGSHDGDNLGGKVWVMNSGSTDHFSKTVADITAISQASNGQVTTAYAHGLLDGNSVRIAGVSGMTEINDINYIITVVDATNFTIGVDTSGYTAYTSGGKVYNAKAISFEMKSAKWNPFNEVGKDTRLGWVDFYVTQDEDDEVTIEFFANEDTTPYQTSYLSFDGTGDKVWKRIHTGAIGNTHSIKISDESTTGEFIELHAVRLTVGSAGRGVL